ncbi:MAG: hypothetical protein AAB861_01070 [Patescibacteria group bacterium]|mgnify:FL=1
MNHWSVDEKELEKDPDKYNVWKLENAINFGLRDGKIKREILLKYWDQLSIDPFKKQFLSLILQK